MCFWAKIIGVRVPVFDEAMKIAYCIEVVKTSFRLFSSVYVYDGAVRST